MPHSVIYSDKYRLNYPATPTACLFCISCRVMFMCCTVTSYTSYLHRIDHYTHLEDHRVDDIHAPDSIKPHARKRSMAQAAISPASIHRTRIRSPSPSQTYQRSPSPSATRTRQSSRLAKPVLSKRRSSQSSSKENENPVHEPLHSTGQNGIRDGMETLIPPPKPHQQQQSKVNGRAPSEEKEMMNGTARSRREESIDSDDMGAGAGPSSTIHARRSQAATGSGLGSGTTPKRQSSQQPTTYNGLPTLPTIGDDDDAFLSSGPPSPSSPGPGRPPPPAPSAQAASDPRYGQLAGSGVRRRRASSIKRKLSPGVTPTKAVDWEIPRKVFHSSIGGSGSS